MAWYFVTLTVEQIKSLLTNARRTQLAFRIISV